MTLWHSVVGEQPIAANATMNVHWRSDPHESRNAPHADPLRYANPTCAAGDSNGNVAGRGNAIEQTGGTPNTLDIGAGSTVPLANAAWPPYFGAEAVRLLGS
jgi:hypothetical protein